MHKSWKYISVLSGSYIYERMSGVNLKSRYPSWSKKQVVGTGWITNISGDIFLGYLRVDDIYGASNFDKSSQQ